MVRGLEWTVLLESIFEWLRYSLCYKTCQDPDVVSWGLAAAQPFVFKNQLSNVLGAHLIEDMDVISNRSVCLAIEGRRKPSNWACRLTFEEGTSEAADQGGRTMGNRHRLLFCTTLFWSVHDKAAWPSSLGLILSTSTSFSLSLSTGWFCPGCA